MRLRRPLETKIQNPHPTIGQTFRNRDVASPGSQRLFPVNFSNFSVAYSYVGGGSGGSSLSPGEPEGRILGSLGLTESWSLFLTSSHTS